MKSYIDIVQHILDTGQWKENRTGIRCLTTFCEIFRHDMSGGFPLLTTKYIPLRLVATELEGFIQCVTDKRWFEKRGCWIWSSWCNPEQLPKELIMLDKNEKEIWDYISGDKKLRWQKENPDLGPLGYSWQLRNFNKPYQPIPFIWIEFDKKVIINNNLNKKYKYIGKKCSSNNNGDFIVIDRVGNKYKIKFCQTGFEKLCEVDYIKSGVLTDPYYPTVYNIACIGEPDRLNPFYRKLYNMWCMMLSRCYNPNHSAYKYYGERGTYVSNSWLIFHNFMNDAQKLCGWDEKKKDWRRYTLDKDYGKKNCYSLENCKWITKNEQQRLTSKNIKFLAKDPTGQEYIDTCIKDFAEKHNLNKGCISQCLLKKRKHTNGWTFKKISNLKPKNVIYQDQLAYIVNLLKKNPNDRRMVVSHWNINDLEKMALPPCHTHWSLVHINGTLNLSWFQRSCDLGLGVPWNISYYALLLLLLCKESNMIPGELVGILSDCHIYENQITNIKKQIKRPPFSLPSVEITSDKEFNIFHWTHKDFVLSDYQHHPSLKLGEVAV